MEGDARAFLWDVQQAANAIDHPSNLQALRLARCLTLGATAVHSATFRPIIPRGRHRRHPNRRSTKPPTLGPDVVRRLDQLRANMANDPDAPKWGAELAQRRADTIREIERENRQRQHRAPAS
jgi:hypothetical protein